MATKILVFAGSNRAGSYNARLSMAAAKELAILGADVTRISLTDYPIPLFDENLKQDKGIPEHALKLGRLVAAHQGVFICSPEYNSSVTPLLKNTIDWLSVISTDGDAPLKPWKGRVVALGSASNGQLGGVRGLYHLRSIMMNVGTQIVTEQCSVSKASSLLGENGELDDAATAEKLRAVCASLYNHCAVYHHN